MYYFETTNSDKIAVCFTDGNGINQELTRVVDVCAAIDLIHYLNGGDVRWVSKMEKQGIG